MKCLRTLPFGFRDILELWNDTLKAKVGDLYVKGFHSYSMESQVEYLAKKLVALRKIGRTEIYRVFCGERGFISVRHFDLILSRSKKLLSSSGYRVFTTLNPTKYECEKDENYAQSV